MFFLGKMGFEYLTYVFDSKQWKKFHKNSRRIMYFGTDRWIRRDQYGRDNAQNFLTFILTFKVLQSIILDWNLSKIK